MAAPDPEKFAKQVKRAAKSCLDLCRPLTDDKGPAFDAIGALDEALSKDDDPKSIVKLAWKALDTTVTCGSKMQLGSGRVTLSGSKVLLIKQKVQPLTWICKDLSKLFKDIGDSTSFAAMKVTQANLVKCRGDQPDAPVQLLKVAEEAVKAFKDLGDVAGEAVALQSMIDGHRLKATLSPFENVRTEETAAALDLAQQQIQLFKSVKDVKGELQACHNLALLYSSDDREGDKDDKFKADQMAEAAFKLALKLGDKDLEVELLQTLMSTRLATEGAYEVERLADEAARRWRRRGSGMEKEVAWAIRTAADALINLGEADEALVKARESLSMCEKLGDKEGQAPALLIIYRCLTMQGSTVEATETLAEAIEMYKEIGDKRSEAIALMEAVKPKLSGLKLPQLADCFFSRDIEDPSYKVSDAAKYRRGDEGMRMAKRASQLFGEIEEPGGADAVDAIIQDAIEKSIQAHIKEFQYIQEKIVLDADEKKPQKKVGVWLVQCPRMMSAAESDEDRARAILRIERDPPAGKPGKGKSAAKKKASESSSDESDSDDDDADDEPKAAAAPKEDKVKVYKGPSLSDIKESVKQAALDMIGADSLASDDALMDAGLDSLGAVEFATMLQKAYAGITLPGTLMFDHPSVSSIAGLMDSELRTAAGFS